MLGKLVADKLYFAGDVYTDGSEWSRVHAAAQSTKRVAEELVGLLIFCLLSRSTYQLRN